MNYEEAIKELEEITEKLNEGKVQISEATKLFDRGVELSKFCYKELNNLKSKVTVVKEELGTLLEEEEQWNFQNYSEKD